MKIASVETSHLAWLSSPCSQDPAEGVDRSLLNTVLLDVDAHAL